jgi:hypothetical protein
VFLFAGPLSVMNAKSVPVASEVPVTPAATQNVATPHEPFGLFRGLTLAEAIRDAESRGSRAAK